MAMAARALGVQTYTLSSPTAAQLGAFLRSLPSSPRATALYLLSTALPPASLEPLIAALASVFPSSIGSFSSPLPSSSRPSSLVGTTGPLVSLAIFPDAHVWRSELRGRPPASVGRWRRPGPTYVEDTRGGAEGSLSAGRVESEGWDSLWGAAGEAGDGIADLDGMEDVSSVVYLADGTPGRTVSALRASRAAADKIGLISAPTPFLTGRPHTLLVHGRPAPAHIAAVGLALPYRLQGRVNFGLEPMSAAMTIRSSRGNMLLSLGEGNGNPAQALIAAIQSATGPGRRISKDESFYLSLRDESGEEKMAKILSGDPSRGALSLETTDPLVAGTQVRFMHGPTSLAAPWSACTPSAGQLTLGVLPKTDELGEAAPMGEFQVQEGFLGLSEGGFVHGSAACSVPGATLVVQ